MGVIRSAVSHLGSRSFLLTGSPRHCQFSSQSVSSCGAALTCSLAMRRALVSPERSFQTTPNGPFSPHALLATLRFILQLRLESALRSEARCLRCSKATYYWVQRFAALGGSVRKGQAATSELKHLLWCTFRVQALV